MATTSMESVFMASLKKSNRDQSSLKIEMIVFCSSRAEARGLSKGKARYDRKTKKQPAVLG